MNRTEHLLTILAEECNEVAQRCTKALRFGLDEVQPGQEKTNAARIVQELEDLSAVWQMLKKFKGLSHLDFNAIEAKKKKVEEFLEYSRGCGTLTESEAAV